MGKRREFWEFEEFWDFLGNFGVSELVQPVVLGREIPGGDILGLHKRPKLGGTLEITAAPDAGGERRDNRVRDKR